MKNFKFDNINVSCQGPFSDNQILEFSDGLTAISAANGMGKTTIFNLLTNYFIERDNYIGTGFKLIKNLIFINDRSFVSGNIISSSIHSKLEVDDLEAKISNHLKRIMNNKFTKGSNKFSRYKTIRDDLTIEINQFGATKFLTANSTDISHAFQAFDEQIALFFSFNLAVREILNIRYPLVCDEILSTNLGSDVSSGLMAELINQDIQLILLAHPLFWERLHIKPTVELVCDSGSKHSIIYHNEL
jgi:hypothetical protein